MKVLHVCVAVGVVALMSFSVVGCGEEEEPQVAQRATVSATSSVLPLGSESAKIWAAGMTEEVYTELGVVSQQTNFGKIRDNGPKPLLVDTLAYQFMNNCADVFAGVKTWDELINDTIANTDLAPVDVVKEYEFVQESICPITDGSKL